MALSRSRLLIMPRIAVTALAILALHAAPGRSQNNVPEDPVWVTDNWATTIACSDRFAYVGGYFHMIAPYTGGGAVVDLKQGDLVPPTPRVAGNVQAVVSDDHGGWFIGGDFTAIGSVPRTDLAHIRADGTVSDWNAPVVGPGAVQVLHLRGGTLYVAGTFNQIGSAWRSNLAALDAGTGNVLEWNPRIAGYVYTMAGKGRTLYLGGLFTTVNDEPRSNLAAVDALHGGVLPWRPDPDREVNAMLVHGGIVYVGGYPMTFGGRWQRSALAAVDAVSGEVLPWDPSPALTPPATPSVLALATRGQTLFVAGSFNSIGGRALKHLAAVDLRTGRAADWEVKAQGVWRLDVHGDGLYLGGDFTWVNDAPRHHLAAVDASTGALLDWAPEANGAVRALATNGGAAYVGGTFRGVGGRARESAAAIDLRTGAIADWNPHVVGFGGVDAIVPSDHAVYLGGDFGTVGGQPRGALAAVDPVSGSVLPWQSTPPYGASVEHMGLDGNSLFFSGLFTEIAGQTRRGFAAVDATTGALLPWDPRAQRDPAHLIPNAYGFTVHHPNVYAMGNFSDFGGQPTGAFAGADVVTGVTSWQPQAVRDASHALAADDVRVYAGQNHGVEALSVADGSSLWFTPQDGSTRGLALDGSTLYMTGPFTAVGGQPRHALAALDAAHGALLGWAPQAGDFAYGRSIAVGGGRVWVASGYGVVALPRARPSRPAMRAAAASLTTGSPHFSFERAPTPVRDRAKLRFHLAGPAVVTLTVFDVQGRRVDRPLDRTPLDRGAHEVSLRTSDWRPGVYLLRLEAGGHAATHRMVILP